MLFWLAFGCTIVPYGGGKPAPVAPDPVAITATGTATGAIVASIDALLSVADEVDRRDRLVELRDLALAADTLDPSIRGRVLAYVERVLAIEARAALVAVVEPITAPGDGGGTPLIVEETIVEVPPGTTPTPTPAPVP